MSSLLALSAFPANFPEEICSRICSYIHSDGPQPLFTKEKAFETLINLSEQSRTWCFSARQIQYETTEAARMTDLASLLNIIRNPNNHIATHIRNFIVGDTHLSDINMSPWCSRIENVQLIHSLIPNLRHLTIGNILHPYFNGTIQYVMPLVPDPVILSPSDGLSELIVRVDLFSSPSQATSLISTMPSLRKLSLLDVYPSFMATLPAFLSNGIRELYLLERQTWPPRPAERQPSAQAPLHLPRNWTLEKFCYAGLSLNTAQQIQSALVQLASHADTEIIFRHWSRKQEATFDFYGLKCRLEAVAKHLLYVEMDLDPPQEKGGKLRRRLNKVFYGNGTGWNRSFLNYEKPRRQQEFLEVCRGIEGLILRAPELREAS